MTKRITIIALLFAFIAVEASAQNRTHRRRGAILGGLAGAAIGAAIGDKGDNETAGALIGGAVGAMAGGTIGNQKDQRIQHNRRYHSGYPTSGYGDPHHSHRHSGHSQFGPVPHYNQPYYYPPQRGVYTSPRTIVTPAPKSVVAPRVVRPNGSGGSAQPVSTEDVIALVHSGLSQETVIQQIRLRGVLYSLSVSDVIYLHQSGVSEQIINAMQGQAPLASAETLPTQPLPSYEIPAPPQER